MVSRRAKRMGRPLVWALVGLSAVGWVGLPAARATALLRDVVIVDTQVDDFSQRPVARLGVDSILGHVFDAEGSTLRTIDTANHRVLATVTASMQLGSLAVDEAHHRVFVTGSQYIPAQKAYVTRVLVFDGATGAQTASVTPCASTLADVAFDPVANRLYVSTGTARLLCVYDGTSLVLVDTVNAGANIRQIDLDVRHGKVEFLSPAVSVGPSIDPTRVFETDVASKQTVLIANVSYDATDIVTSAALRRSYIISNSIHAVYVIDLDARWTAPFLMFPGNDIPGNGVPPYSVGLALDPTTNNLFVSTSIHPYMFGSPDSSGPAGMLVFDTATDTLSGQADLPTPDGATYGIAVDTSTHTGWMIRDRANGMAVPLVPSHAVTERLLVGVG